MAERLRRQACCFYKRDCEDTHPKVPRIKLLVYDLIQIIYKIFRSETGLSFRVILTIKIILIKATCLNFTLQIYLF